MSTAAKIKPPRSPRFLRSWILFCARISSSASCQNLCPAYVVGTIEPIRTKAARRGNFSDGEESSYRLIWTTPFNRTNVRESS